MRSNCTEMLSATHFTLALWIYETGYSMRRAEPGERFHHDTKTWRSSSGRLCLVTADSEQTAGTTGPNWATQPKLIHQRTSGDRAWRFNCFLNRPDGINLSHSIHIGHAITPNWCSCEKQLAKGIYKIIWQMHTCKIQLGCLINWLVLKEKLSQKWKYAENVLPLRPSKMWMSLFLDQIWRNVALHHLNGCRQNESPNSW